jgi:cell division septation protein DedD
VDGRVLHFFLAGINNQNFLMRDKETGTWWQQITGRAIYGPLKGASLELVLIDELTFGEWKTEVPDGKVLAEVPKYVKEYDSNWEPEVAKLPVVISFPGTELKSRDLVVGLEMAGPGRAYPWDTLVKQSPVLDHVDGTPLLIAVGPDGKSFRVFVSRIDGKDAEFFLKGEADSEPATQPAGQTKSDVPGAKPDTKAETKAPPAVPASPDAKPDASSVAKPTAPATPKAWTLLDTTTASEWNFQGCAISGPSLGKCLDRIPALKDYWFDWRNYHPDTTIYKRY